MSGTKNRTFEVSSQSGPFLLYGRYRSLPNFRACETEAPRPLIEGTCGAQPKFTLFRMPYVNGLRHERGALRGSLRGGATELELELIKLIDDLAHDCLIRVGRTSQRSLRLWGGSDRRNCRRCRDENRWRRP